MFSRLATGLLAFALAGCIADPEPFKPTDIARIALSAASNESWVATYVLPEPASELIFARQPDDSRTQDWKGGPGYEVVQVDGVERIRRTDGQPFTEALVYMPPLYRSLPKDYGPFSPFGDGGLLAHTGRFFACPAECPSNATWQMSLGAPNRTILAAGKRFRDEARWTDTADGQNIYVGQSAPTETPDFLAVIDAALPEAIRTQLSQQMPHFMHLFAEHLGELPERPMLFASYDLAHKKGMGRQGGTLPGQVFVHFYGSGWTAQMAAPGFTEQLAWHFAHEAAHLYQHQVFTDTSRGAGIHEGGAEAMAAIALSLDGRADVVKQHVGALADKCRKLLGSRTIQAALTESDFDVAYACGIQVNLAIDADLRARFPDKDGLFAVWRRYIARVGNRTAVEADFFAAIADVGGADLASRIETMVSMPNPVLPAAQLPTQAGSASW
ncbi:MAG: hypothetical protein EON61_11925 [Alphaproteobacteria bacterium]|nr:MAG: hypothetical protein EON61_11925 [Alphaproteobacteria bacterium]